MIFTLVFGLSMDYEVFLLSRMREEWLRTGDNTKAVGYGLMSSATMTTAAAAIMVCIFGSFVIGDPLRILDVLGLGLTTAALVDATIVPMVLVPAVMELPGSPTGGCPASRRRAAALHGRRDCWTATTTVPSINRDRGDPVKPLRPAVASEPGARFAAPALVRRLCWDDQIAGAILDHEHPDVVDAQHLLSMSGTGQPAEAPSS